MISDRIAIVKFSKRRCQRERTCGDLVDRVTVCAICSCQGQAPLLPGIHLRVSAREKNQIENCERCRPAGDVYFFERFGAHVSGQSQDAYQFKILCIGRH